MKDQLVPELRFEEFEGEWEPSKLRSIVQSVNTGKSVNSTGQVGVKEGPAIMKTSCVESGTFKPLENKMIVPEEAHLAKCSVKEDTIIVSRMNTPLLVGESGYVHRSYDQLYLPDRLWMLSFSHKVSANFISFLFNGSTNRKKISSIASGTSGSMKNISKSEFLDLKFPLPTLPEQQKIATFLSLVDRRLAAARRRVEVLEEWKRGVMQQLIRSNRDKWEFFYADKLFKSVSNKKHNGDLPVLAITQGEGAVFRDDLDRHIHSSSKSVASYKIVDPGDFIISLRSFQGGIEYSNIRGIASPAYTVLKPKKPIVDGFYRFYLKYPDFISRLDEASIGIRDGRQISYSTFSELQLPYPPLAEQTRISTILTTIDARITAAQKEVAGWEEWKRGLLQKMLV